MRNMKHLVVDGDGKVNDIYINVMIRGLNVYIAGFTRVSLINYDHAVVRVN